METKQLAYFVYIHTFPNGKKYVGCTTRKPECRWREGKGYYLQKHLYNAILKHGWNNITHEVFEVDSKEEMYRKEIELISFYHSNDPEYGYNLSTGGEGSTGPHPSWKGGHHSPETRHKISEALKEKSSFKNPEHRQHLSEFWKGREKPWLKGKPRSEETRRKISETLKKRKRSLKKVATE